jgi:tetratricopeptide (TPR) repeat protein
MIRQLLFLLLFTFSVAALAEGEREVIYNAYLSNDMPSWKRVIETMNAEVGKSPDRELELLNYEYGYIGWCIGNKRKSEARIYLERGLKRIALLMEKKHQVSQLHAYQSAFYGFQIGLANLKAPKLGPRSINAAKKSIAIDSDNALGYIQLGNIDYFMPPLFGGSKERALGHYLHAERLLAPRSAGDWNNLALLVQIATAYEETGNIAKADTYYRKVLSIAPQFSWVKNERYPAFIKKHNNQ